MRVSFIRGVISVAIAYMLHVTAIFSFIVYEGCAGLPEEENPANASLRVSLTEAEDGTKVSSLLGLDTSSFILKVYSQSGTKVYDGEYGKRPASFSVPGGAYRVGIISDEFLNPAFNEFVLGDETDLVLSSGEESSVNLLCSQVNCGVRINCSSEFIDHFGGRGLFLNNKEVSPVVDSGSSLVSGDGTGLFYTFNETRYGCFLPGVLNVCLRRSSARPGSENTMQEDDSLLFTRAIDAAQMLSFNFDWSAGGTKSSFKVEVDTVREWLSDTYNPGCLVPDDAVTIEEAQQMVGSSNVKVFGYIIGGDVTETSFRTSAPFTAVSNLLLAPSVGERNRNNCLAVELPSSSSVRDGLNLVSHPNLVGKAVTLTGRIVEKYMGYIGMKRTKEYSILF